MRRFLAVLFVVPLLTACSDGGPAGDIKVAGAFGRQPTVTIPKTKPAGKLDIKTLIEGKGATVSKGDLVVANYVGYKWGAKENRQVASSYANGQPAAFPFGRLVPGLDKTLADKKVGSRLMAVIPPSLGYGASGNQQLQITADDSLVFVIDLLASYPKTAAAKGIAQPLKDPALPEVGAAQPGQAPQVTIPKSAPPSKLEVKTLIRGAGQPVRSGQLLVAHFLGQIWSSGKTFDSSWAKGQPSAFAIGLKQVVPGWDQGLVEQPVGSRVLLVVPPKWGYGPKGLNHVGIKGTDTLVFVVDILGVY